jgi:hypothetical protein
MPVVGVPPPSLALALESVAPPGPAELLEVPLSLLLPQAVNAKPAAAITATDLIQRDLGVLPTDPPNSCTSARIARQTTTYYS